MKAPSLRLRIPAALRLEPMSPNELARVLSIRPNTARKSLRELQSLRMVRPLSDGRGWINEPRARRHA